MARGGARADGQAAMPPKGTQKDLEKVLRDFFTNQAASSTKASSGGISFEQALLFDEIMLNSWFQESGMTIKDRADWLQYIRQYKDDFSHQSTEAIEDELSSKMLFDALLFVVGITLIAEVESTEMQAAWNTDVTTFASRDEPLVHAGTYDAILPLMTFIVTSSTGIALVVGFTIFTCLRYERPLDMVEADKFYARFKWAYLGSYVCTYAAILLIPFSCYELHLVKTRDLGIRKFMNIYGILVYVVLLLFLIWSLFKARYWRFKVLAMRGENKVPYMINSHNRRESLKRLQSQTWSQTLESYGVMPLSPASKQRTKQRLGHLSDTSNIPPQKTASPASEQAQPTPRTASSLHA